uniref:Uncharacterized protein n=1 Tax=Lepeophtheirus salmonis TaxID=72036 RepID=A0A0K2TW93_LEPSM
MFSHIIIEKGTYLSRWNLFGRKLISQAFNFSTLVSRVLLKNMTLSCIFIKILINFFFHHRHCS